MRIKLQHEKWLWLLAALVCCNIAIAVKPLASAQEVSAPATALNYVVKEVCNGEMVRGTSGTADEGTEVVMPYRRYNLYAGKLYKRDPEGGDKKLEYRHYFTLNEDNQEEQLDYSLAYEGTVVYLSEGEDIEGMALCTSNNATVRSSNAAAAYAKDGNVKITTLEPGTYRLTAGIHDSSSSRNSKWTFLAGDEVVAELLCTVANLEELNSGTFTLTEEKDIYIAKGGGSNRGLDYVYISKAEELPVMQLTLNETETIDATYRVVSEDEKTIQLFGSSQFGPCVSSDVAGDLVVPAEYNGYTVVGISSWAFRGCNALTSVTLPETVAFIGESAFRGCTSMTTINMPASVTSVGTYAFAGAGLTELVWSPAAKDIPQRAFYSCQNLQEVNIPEGVETIGDEAFYKSQATLFVLPSTLKSVGSQGLRSVSAGVVYVCKSTTPAAIPAINATAKDRHAYIPAGTRSAYRSEWGVSFGFMLEVDDIENMLINATVDTNDGTIPAKYRITDYLNRGVELYGTYEGGPAIAKSTSGEITIPATVTSELSGYEYQVTGIGDWALHNCSSLTGVSISAPITYIGASAFRSCSGITSMTIPETVTTIGDSAFRGCGITSVKVPEGVNRIENSALYSSAITFFELPSTLAYIGEQSVRGADDAVYVSYAEKPAEVHLQNSFAKNKHRLYVPADTRDAYKASQYWNYFAYKDIYEAEDVADGNYYLRLAGTDQFLAANGNALTLAADGLAVNVRRSSEFSYEIGSSAGALTWNTLPEITLDGSLQNQPWTIVRSNDTEGSVWLQPQIQPSYGSYDFCHTYLGVDADDATLMAGTSAACNWELITEDDYKTIKGQAEPATDEIDLTQYTLERTIDFTQAVAGLSDDKYITLDLESPMGTAFEAGNKKQQQIYAVQQPEDWQQLFAFQMCYSGYPSKGWHKDGKGLYPASASRSGAVLNRHAGDLVVFEVASGDIEDCMTLTNEEGYPDGPYTYRKSDDGLKYYCQMAADGQLNFSGKKNKRIAAISIYNSKSTPVSVAANDITIGYGDEIPELTYRVSGGSVSGTPQLECSATKESKPGVYAIRISKGSVTTEGALYANGRLTIEKGTITVTAQNAEKYVGSENPELTVSYEGWKNGWTEAQLVALPTVSTTAQEESPAGFYPITATGANSGGYYNFVYVDGVMTVKEHGQVAGEIPVMAETNSVTAQDVEAAAGGIVKLPIELKNTKNISGLQFDLTLPAGVSIVRNERGKYVLAKSSRGEYHILTGNLFNAATNTYRLLLYSAEGDLIEGSEGTIATISLMAGAGMAEGDYSIQLTNIVLSTPDEERVKPADKTSKLTISGGASVADKGDANGDGAVDVVDITAVANYILGQSKGTFVETAADVNSDGDIDVVDITGVANIILGQGKATAAPQLLLNRASAADVLSAASITVPQGGQAQLDIVLDNPGKQYSGLQFELAMSSGLTLAKNDKGRFVITRGARLAEEEDLTISVNEKTDAAYTVLSYYSPSSGQLGTYPGTSGTLFSLTVEADAELTVGNTIDCRLSGVVLSTPDEEKVSLGDITFTVTVGEPSDGRTLLDENATAAPATASNVDVRVKRTINPDVWSTICLPFAMTEAQVKTAFGENVLLGDFSSWESEEDDEGDIIAINVGFTPVSAIEANHPYIIKVSEPVSEFTADGVTISPEEEPTVQVGKKKAERGFFTGVYAAGTAVPENDLFLGGGKFWYSTGKSKIQAFRAYFEFYDKLATLENASSRVMINFGIDATGIVSIGSAQPAAGEAAFDVQGREILNGKSAGNRLNKGIYIINNKKVVVK